MPKSAPARKPKARPRKTSTKAGALPRPKCPTLSHAAHLSDWDSAVALLALGAPPDRTSPPHLDPPLSIACMRADPRMAKLLLGAGADPGKPSFSGEPPIATACRSGSLGVALALCAAGADPRAAAPGGPTPMEIAKARGDFAMADLLAVAIARRRQDSTPA